MALIVHTIRLITHSGLKEAPLVRIQIALLCLIGTCVYSQAQIPTTPTRAAEKIWESVFKLGVGHQITVKTTSGSSYHGQISRIADNEFEIREVARS